MSARGGPDGAWRRKREETARSEERGKPRREHEGEGALVDGGRGWREGAKEPKRRRGLGRKGLPWKARAG